MPERIPHQTSRVSATLAEHRDRVWFLSEASRALSGSLNLERTLLRFLNLVVPELATVTYVALVGPRSTAWSGLAAGRKELLESRTGMLHRGSLEGDVLAAGQAISTGPAPFDALGLAIPGLADLSISHSGELTAYAFPLTARGTTFGVGVALRQDDDPADEALRELLAELMQRAAFALDAARLYGERSQVASVLQASLLPPRLPDIENVRLAARYRSAFDHAEIGGDFYDVHGAGGDWTVVVGDVCGKGVEAAVLTGQARTAVRTAALVDRRPSQVLKLLNGVLVGQSDDSGTFVTVSCGRLRPDPDGSGARLDLASAGHPPPLVLRADGTVEVADVSGVVAGLFPDGEWPEMSVLLGPGDCCLFYTDGVTEARGDSGLLGDERLVGLVRRCAGSEPEVVVDIVAAAVNDHLRGRSHDDIALLAVGVPT